MPKLDLRQPGFTYSACGAFTKYHERTQKFKEKPDLKYIHKNELDKPCFAQDDAYSDSKYLAKTIISDNILKDKAYKNAINPKYDEYQEGLVSVVYKFFYKKTGLGVASKSRKSVNELLAQE